MPQTLTIHRVGDPEQLDRGGEAPPLTAAAFEEIIASSEGPLAIVTPGIVHPDDLAGAASVDSDVTVVITDATTTTGGRGSTDLCAVLWQSFPAVAALLGDSLLEAGGIVFGEAGRQRIARPVAAAGDPIVSAIATIVQQGGTLRAVLVPAGSEPVLPVNPPGLVPSGSPADRQWLCELIRGAEAHRWLGQTASEPDVIAIKAGLLLWHDFLDESHKLSQSIEGAGTHRAGDYWHAIMHRREGDYGNSKYWFRRVGLHPVYETLAARRGRLTEQNGDAARLLEQVAPGGIWDPSAFVDACQRAARANDPAAELTLRRLQADEMLLLLWQTCLDARG